MRTHLITVSLSHSLLSLVVLVHLHTPIDHSLTLSLFISLHRSSHRRSTHRHTSLSLCLSRKPYPSTSTDDDYTSDDLHDLRRATNDLHEQRSTRRSSGERRSIASDDQKAIGNRVGEIFSARPLLLKKKQLPRPPVSNTSTKPSEGMDTADEVVDRPPPEFQEDVKDPVIDLSLTDSTELWLIQWPINQAVDFDGQELSLKLHHDGLLGSFEGSSGKSYDVVSYNAEVPNATVFLSSASESKIVGKISRRVSLVHYPEPSELEKQNTSHQKQMYQRSSGTSLTNSSHRFATHTQSTRPRSSKSSGSNAASMRSSKYTSSLSEIGEPSKPPKRKHTEEPTRSMDQFTQDSGRGHSVVTSSGSLEQSNDRKSRKKKKLVE